MTPAEEEARSSEQIRAIIRDALAVRDRWSGFFAEVVGQPELSDPALHERILTTAEECRGRMVAYRAELRQTRTPAGMAALVGRVDAWIWRYILILEAAGKITPPVTREALGRIGDLMREASGSLGFEGVGGDVSLFRTEAEPVAAEDTATTAVAEPELASSEPAHEAELAGEPAEAGTSAAEEPSVLVGPEPPAAVEEAEAPAVEPEAERSPASESAPPEGERSAAAEPGPAEPVSLTRAGAPARPGQVPPAEGAARQGLGAPVQRRAAAGISVALLLIVAAGLLWATRSEPGPPTPTPLSFVTTAREQGDVRLRVVEEVRARGLPLTDVDVRLLPPNRIGISGTITRPEGPEPIELQYVLGVGPDGRAIATPVDMVALNPELKPPPPELEAALAQISRELAPVPPEGQVLRRVVVLNDVISGEFGSATTP